MLDGDGGRCPCWMAEPRRRRPPPSIYMLDGDLPHWFVRDDGYTHCSVLDCNAAAATAAFPAATCSTGGAKGGCVAGLPPLRAQRRGGLPGYSVLGGGGLSHVAHGCISCSARRPRWIPLLTGAPLPLPATGETDPPCDRPRADPARKQGRARGLQRCWVEELLLAAEGRSGCGRSSSRCTAWPAASATRGVGLAMLLVVTPTLVYTSIEQISLTFSP